MPYYGRQNPQPLSPTDWEKVQGLWWSSQWREVVLRFLKKIREDGPVLDQGVNVSGVLFSLHQIGEVINGGFRRAGLPYRFFPTAYGGRIYTIGIIMPIRRKSTKPKKVTLKAEALRDLIKVARALGRRSTPKNISLLRKALRNPNLPS